MVATENGTENRIGYIERTNGGIIIEMENISQLYSGLVASSESDEDLAARTSLTNIGRCPITTTDGTYMQSQAFH